MRLTLGQAAEVRLGRQRAPQFEAGEHVVPYLRSANVTDGELDLDDVKQMNFTPEEQSIFRLMPGDVLLTEGSGSRATVGTSAVWQGEIEDPICFQNTLLRLRPRHGVTDGRYLAWWARHVRASGEIAAVSTGANILHIGSDGLKRLRLTVPSLEQQRRIADFLDDRVARIDRIIAARREQVGALVDHEQSRLTGLLLKGADRVVPLRRLGVQVTTGPFGTQFAAAEYVSGGVPMINPTHIKGGVLVPDPAHTVSIETAARLSRHALRKGDLVISRKGDIGRTAEVLGPQDGWICGSDSIALHATESWISPAFLNLLLKLNATRDQLLAQSSGATMPSLNEGNLLSLRVPALPRDEQEGRVREGVRTHEELMRARVDLLRFIDLLTEYKTSLITAAVTGELDVTTAGSGIPA